MNFSQIGIRPSVDRLDLDVGRGRIASRMARTRVGQLRGGSPNTSPKTMRRCVPVCSITPGAAIAVAT